MREDIIRRFKKVGAIVSDDRHRIDVPLPSDEGKAEGKLTTVFLEENTLFNLIDIHSTIIPDLVAKPVWDSRKLKINYCVRGRCELQLKSEGCTYLTAGEIAIDAGQAENSFYFPGAEYLGYEVIVYMDCKGATDKGKIERCQAAEDLYRDILSLDRPWIQKAGKFLASFYDAFQYYTEENFCRDLLYLRCFELMNLLVKTDFDGHQMNRTYYTASQVKIAKMVREQICADLSVRYTAKAMAEQFGVSETSVKNYFRSVYGCGFAEFQQYARMERAASLLKDTDDKLCDISLAVGYASQPKFGAAFKAFYGMTPLEYRRMKKLED